MKTAACLLAALLTLPATAQDGFPKRKPGLWEVSMQAPGLGTPMAMQQCVDAASDAAMQRRAMSGEPGAQCKHLSTKPIAGGVEVRGECTGPQGRQQIVSRMAGDMNARYTVVNEVTFDPPRHGQAKAAMTMEAVHKGACPAGMKPGEMQMPGMNAEQMRAMREQMREQKRPGAASGPRP